MTALNFDPYAALAEIENRNRLGANRANEAKPTRALAPLAPLAPIPAATRKATTCTSDEADRIPWRGDLNRVDPATAPHGFSPERWSELVEDARWLTDRHGASAAALGWTASDLFGLDDTLDGWGGLVDRLRGARRVTFTDTIAHWRSDEIDGWLWRRTLRPMRTLWEFAQ